MTKHTEIEIKEDSNIKVSVKGLVWLISVVVASTVWVASYQINTNHKIEQLYTQNQAQHEAIMIKLTEMDKKQEMFALKAGVENCLIYIVKQRDAKLGITNSIGLDEMKLRSEIKNFLSN